MNKPCKHPGCQSHISHPREGCGRQWNSDRVLGFTRILNDHYSNARMIERIKNGRVIWQKIM